MSQSVSSCTTMTTNRQVVSALRRLCASRADFTRTSLVVGELGQSLQMPAKLTVSEAVVEIAIDPLPVAVRVFEQRVADCQRA